MWQNSVRFERIVWNFIPPVIVFLGGPVVFDKSCNVCQDSLLGVSRDAIYTPLALLLVTHSQKLKMFKFNSGYSVCLSFVFQRQCLVWHHLLQDLLLNLK